MSYWYICEKHTFVRVVPVVPQLLRFLPEFPLGVAVHKSRRRLLQQKDRYEGEETCIESHTSR